MTLQAEIQKRQQAVSDLKRQVEQITALAGDDKKAGIRVADALRKRKSGRPQGCQDPRPADVAPPGQLGGHLLVPVLLLPRRVLGRLDRSTQGNGRRHPERGQYGGDQAIAAPRGEGKTSIVQCVTIYCVMHGILSFPLIAAATGPNAEQILANIKYQLERNQALADDYPEICDPILALDGTAQRGATQTANGKRTFLKWAQDYIVLPTVRVPDHWDQRLRPGQLSLGSGAVITTRGLDSAIRGVLVGTKRPDLVIIDDPETRDSARSGVQTDLRARTIEADLAGPWTDPASRAGPRDAHHDDEQLQPAPLSHSKLAPGRISRGSFA